MSAGTRAGSRTDRRQVDLVLMILVGLGPINTNEVLQRRARSTEMP
jgi:hypothetical protein